MHRHCATVAYNYNFIRDIKDNKNEVLLEKHNENYFDALLYDQHRKIQQENIAVLAKMK